MRYGWWVVLFGCALTAWAALGLDTRGIAMPGLCAPLALGPADAASIGLVLAVNPPGMLAIGWGLMIAAMMPPLLIAPLRHVGNNSLARRRSRMMTLFCVGYASAWMAAGAALLPLSLLCRLIAAGSAPPFLVGLAVALAWQISPVRQRCLNGCHRRPALAAFGVAAVRDALAFGLSQGAWCVGACWALMALPMLESRFHLFAMAAVALVMTAERIEPPAAPAWALRLPRKGLRIAAAQLRMRLNQVLKPV